MNDLKVINICDCGDSDIVLVHEHTTQVLFRWDGAEYVPESRTEESHEATLICANCGDAIMELTEQDFIDAVPDDLSD